ncbi:MAG: acylneuraminate cytidylyltransferase family protein [Saprospiraceae bacterium]
MKVLAIIPARSGSKSLKDKNILSFLGKPLLVHSIDHALKSSLINRVILSTDSEYYAEIGRVAGAEVPFLRPEKISGDLSLDIEVFTHALHYLATQESYHPDLVVHLRPTSPIRNVEDIDAMIRILADVKEADSIRAITKSKDTPYKMWLKGEQHEIVPVINQKEFPEAYNMPRQVLPQAYIQTASIDVMRSGTILEKKSMTGDIILGYEIADFIDIDNDLDFEMAIKASYTGSIGKRYCFDMDGVIAHLSPNNDYSLAKPNFELINSINSLYEKGNYIIIFTARGSATGLDWHEITIKQLLDWGVRYHEFHTGKPYADYYIDDKNLLVSQLLKNKL